MEGDRVKVEVQADQRITVEELKDWWSDWPADQDRMMVVLTW